VVRGSQELTAAAKCQCIAPLHRQVLERPDVIVEQVVQATDVREAKRDVVPARMKGDTAKFVLIRLDEPAVQLAVEVDIVPDTNALVRLRTRDDQRPLKADVHAGNRGLVEALVDKIEGDANFQ